ncbi:hypothetical protein PEC18_39555, partial [Paucibacter sp. O1-1]|nr:hypothetical protein [Paucibacter sp. O1-1]MDA3831707.1 hypothetical protein [Paucibacter sp. O1-1]
RSAFGATPQGTAGNPGQAGCAAVAGPGRSQASRVAAIQVWAMLHGYTLSLLEGAALTLAVALASLAIALALGAAGAVAKLSRSRAARGTARPTPR